MLRTAIVAFLALFVGLLPTTGMAQENQDTDRGDVVIRLNGDFLLPAGESIGSAVIIRGDAESADTVLLLVNRLISADTPSPVEITCKNKVG